MSKGAATIVLDRDGVINKDLGTYCYKSKDFEPIEGSTNFRTREKSL